jgi:hypothetical protein
VNRTIELSNGITFKDKGTEILYFGFWFNLFFYTKTTIKQVLDLLVYQMNAREPCDNGHGLYLNQKQ